MKSILIAEFGLCHNGSLDSVKDLIRAAKDCGATLAKGQAFKSEDVKGSMPKGFYDAREFTLMQLIELVQYGETIGIPVFFSVFSKEFESIKQFQKWHKYSAGQSKSNPRMVERNDKYNVIASVNLFTRLPWLTHSHVMYATAYLPDNPGLEAISFLSEFYGRQIGYSDHTLGVAKCLEAFKEHGAYIIEKHFTLTRDIYFSGRQFRDAIHGALPSQLSQLAKGMNL